MTDPGLDHRLRIRSRRAGFMIGMSMALTIAVCIGAFSVIFASLDDTFGDFLSRGVAATVTPTGESAPQTTIQNTAPGEATTSSAPPTQPPPATTAPQSTEPPTAFVPDYQTSSDFSIRLRSEPSRSGGDATIITTLPPETPLQFTGTDQAATDPEDGDRWMLFRTEDGEEGWIREIDVNPYVP